MKIKSILIAGAILLFCSCSVYAQNTVTLKGKVVNAGNMVTVADFSEFENLERPSPERTFVPDSSGNFSITFKLASPNYFRIGRNKLYLSPGDSLECYIDGKNQAVARFSGIGSEANNYLRFVPFPKAGSYLNAAQYLYQSPVATLDTIVSFARHYQKELSALKNVSAEFKKLEEVRINCDLYNSVYSVASYLTSFNIATRGEGNEDYNRTIKAMAVPVLADFPIPVDADYLKVEVYRDIISECIESKPVNAEAAKIKDWLTAVDIAREMNDVSDKSELKKFDGSIAAIKTPVYKLAAEKYQQNLETFGKGDFAVDVNCITNSLKRVSLSSLRGKVIYVDLWATWCGPCLAEMPAYERLKEKYKDNPAIAFVSISIDDESKYKDWLKNLEDRKATGNQWQVNRNMLNAYNITGIPRVIIIGKDFRIAEMNGPLPSSKELPAQLDKLIKM